MKARLLVAKVDAGAVFTTVFAVADEATVDDNPDWLHVEQVEQLRRAYGDPITHGFVDIEIPDEVIDRVLTNRADAGVVAAAAVEEGRS